MKDSAGTTLKSFTYGTSGPDLRKLETATRHNRIQFAGANRDFVVSQRYDYLTGSEARLGSRTTAVQGGGFNERRRQVFTYTANGQLDTEQFPCQWNGSSCTDTPPTLDRNYHLKELTKNKK